MPKYNPNSIWRNRSEAPKEREAPVNAVAARPVAADESAGNAAPRTEPQETFFKKTPLEQFDEEDAPASRHGLLWFVIIFVVVAGGGLLYFFFMRPPAGLNVGISFAQPNQVLVGDPFQFSVSVSNNSNSILRNATLSIFLPANISFAGQSSDQRVKEQTLGDLGPGSIVGSSSSITLIVTGDPNSVKHINAKLLYGTDASPKTKFETDGGADVVVGGPAITLTITPPTNVFSGQDFDTVVNYVNNTSHSFQNVILSLQYPPAYIFSRSTVAANSAVNNTWSLGTIPAAGAGTITVTGNIVGPQNANYAIAANLVGEVSGETYALSSQTANTAVSASPLSLAVTLNNSSAYVAGLDDTLSYVIAYSNSANVTFQNVTITAALVGAMFDFSTLQASGAFSSVNNTVTWYAANTPQLLNIAPGQSGSVNFTVKTKSSYPIRLLSDKNYTLAVNAQVSSLTVPAGTAASSTVSVVSMENKVSGSIMLATKGYHKDPSADIQNSGPYPPKVNKATQYTIHWVITNYATDASSVVVTASLQGGTTCTGVIKSNMPTAPTCNSGTGVVNWTIPMVPATTGITGPPAEAIFQLQNTPAVNQVDNVVTLLGGTTLQAIDAFTGSALSASAAPVTTNLPDDTSVPGNVNRAVSQ